MIRSNYKREKIKPCLANTCKWQEWAVESRNDCFTILCLQSTSILHCFQNRKTINNIYYKINFSDLTVKETFLVSFTLQTFLQYPIICVPDRWFVELDVNISIWANWGCNVYFKYKPENKLSMTNTFCHPTLQHSIILIFMRVIWQTTCITQTDRSWVSWNHILLEEVRPISYKWIIWHQKMNKDIS